MKFLKPTNLDLGQLILSKEYHLVNRRVTENKKSSFKLTFTKSKFLLKHVTYCYYIVDLIIQRSKQNKDSLGYVNLRGKLLDQVIPHETRILVLSLLEALEVLEINETFNPGIFSKSYRINSKYSLTDLETIEFLDERTHHIGELHSDSLIHDSVDPDSVLDTKAHHIGEPNSDIKGKKGRSKSLCSGHFQKAERVQAKKKQQRDKKTVDLLSLREYRFQQDQVFNINLDFEEIEQDGKREELLYLMEKVSSGDLSINVNNSVNRVFSPITNLKKEYRKYLRCKEGYSLMEIDFKSSHLFHLIRMIEQEGKVHQTLEIELSIVKRIATEGDMYQHVADRLPELKLDRCSAKKLFISSFLYGMYPNRKISQQVKGLFPSISKYIDSKGRRKISIDLQRSEAHLLNNRIFKRIAEELPGCTAYGVFDSILVDENHFDQVYGIMDVESIGYFGYEVPLTTKDVVVTIFFSNRSETPSLVPFKEIERR